jgi:hypothetical protein
VAAGRARGASREEEEKGRRDGRRRSDARGRGLRALSPTPGRMGFIDPWIKNGSREGLAFWTTPVVKKRMVLICLRRDRTVPRLKTL